MTRFPLSPSANSDLKTCSCYPISFPISNSHKVSFSWEERNSEQAGGGEKEARLVAVELEGELSAAPWHCRHHAMPRRELPNRAIAVPWSHRRAAAREDAGPSLPSRRKRERELANQEDRPMPHRRQARAAAVPEGEDHPRRCRSSHGRQRLPPTSATAKVRRRCAVERKAVQSRRAGETERSEGVLGTQPPCLATNRVTGTASVGTAAIRKGFWSPGVALRLPGPPPELLATSAVAEKIAVDLPELLAAAGAVAGPVRNRSCLIVLFRVAMVIANVTGAEVLVAVSSG
ncbi:uncharacterized protein DS421_17g581480 [Arachis hypogaea]|nr:uncharacterized protein DS421_17g581480 [Arachis hypogaea]